MFFSLFMYISAAMFSDDWQTLFGRNFYPLFISKKMSVLGEKSAFSGQKFMSWFFANYSIFKGQTHSDCCEMSSYAPVLTFESLIFLTNDVD